MARRPQSVSDRVLRAATTLAAERPWGTVALGEIAAEAGIGLAELHGAFRSKAAIVAALMAQADEKVVAGADPAAGDEPARERLLDALMRRLDAIAPHKPAVRSMLRGTAIDPVQALCLAPRFLNSMRWTLEAAGIGSAGPAGSLRARALGAIYLSGLCVWVRDEGEDQGRTMAYLDRRLRQAERLAVFLPGSGRLRARTRRTKREAGRAG